MHAKSYKATPGRLAVLAVLRRAKKPLTIPEIIAKVGKDTSDPATVYRTILTLKASGLIQPINFHHGLTYYELASLDEHHHVVCLKCQRVADVAECCVEADMQQNALQQSGFAEIQRHSLEFFGMCKNCQSQE